MHRRSVLISGVGIAGLTLAYWLLEQGFRPTLVERAPGLRTGGYIIDFWGLGYEVAQRMGLISDLKRDGYDVQELRFVDERGRRIGGFSADALGRLTNGRYVSILRRDLATLIYRKVEGRVETLFGDGIAEVKPDAEGAWVSFERSPTRRFDLVIGADGLHSVVRKLAFERDKRFEKYLGYVTAAFEIEGYRPRDDRAYVSYTVPGRQVARFALRGDRTMFFFIFAANDAPNVRHDDTEAQKKALKAEFDNAGWECPQILAAMDRSRDIYFDRVSQIRMNTWSRGPIALVGDAAFCPSLLAGQGAALAMTGAYVLAGELGLVGKRLREGLRRYEQLLRPFMMEKQASAERMAGSFAPKTRLGIFWRNQLTRAFSVPLIASLVIGRTLTDRLRLPDYPINPSTGRT